LLLRDKKVVGDSTFSCAASMRFKAGVE
jgi:hypothetical protein